MKIKNILILSASMAAVFSSCLSDGDETIILENGVEKNALGIPVDNFATPNPTIDVNTLTMPKPTVNPKVEKGETYALVEIPGIWDDTNGQWLTLYGTSHPQQNVWVSIDNEPKGFDVINVADDDSKRKLADDVVILFDNSTSMESKADAIAEMLLAWANKISKTGVDLRIGVVGYGGDSHAIDGALNVTTVDAFAKFMKEASGNDRTKRFGGQDAAKLEEAAVANDYYENGTHNESGVVALRYAHDNFGFRQGANRIYVNITDEANQPNGIAQWSVEYLNPANGYWSEANGIVHTVFVGDKQEWNKPNYEENPWLMSTYTSGMTIFGGSDLAEVSFDKLPVTGPLQNSYQLRVGNVKKYIDGQYHSMLITILTPDGHLKSQSTTNFCFTDN